MCRTPTWLTSSVVGAESRGLGPEIADPGSLEAIARIIATAAPERRIDPSSDQLVERVWSEAAVTARHIGHLPQE